MAFRVRIMWERGVIGVERKVNQSRVRRIYIYIFDKWLSIRKNICTCTSLASKGIVTLKLHSFRTKTSMPVWIWETDVTASSIQLRAAGWSLWNERDSCLIWREDSRIILHFEKQPTHVCIKKKSVKKGLAHSYKWNFILGDSIIRDFSM